MGRKSSAKANKEASTPPPDQPRSKTPLMAITLVIVALVAGGLALWSDSTPTEAEQAAAQFPDRGPIPADLKPHPQANLPPPDGIPRREWVLVRTKHDTADALLHV